MIPVFQDSFGLRSTLFISTPHPSSTQRGDRGNHNPTSVLFFERSFRDRGTTKCRHGPSTCQRERPREETKLANTLILDFSLLNWERIDFCCLSQVLLPNKKKLYTSLVVWPLFWGWERERNKGPVRWEMSSLALPLQCENLISTSSFTGYPQWSISIQGVMEKFQKTHRSLPTVVESDT